MEDMQNEMEAYRDGFKDGFKTGRECEAEERTTKRSGWSKKQKLAPQEPEPALPGHLQ